MLLPLLSLLQLLDLEASGISTAPQQKISLLELSAQVGGGALCPQPRPPSSLPASLGRFLVTPARLPACQPPTGPRSVSLPDLRRPACPAFPPPQCDSEASADRLFEQLRSALGAGTGALAIKPAAASSGLGMMRVASGSDLMVYAQVGAGAGGCCAGRHAASGGRGARSAAAAAAAAGLRAPPLTRCQAFPPVAAAPGASRRPGWRMLPACPQAVECWLDVIPGELLSGGGDVPMVVPPPSQFVVEPFVTTEPVQVGPQPPGTWKAASPEQQGSTFERARRPNRQAPRHAGAAT